jgi:hypothetical protein
VAVLGQRLPVPLKAEAVVKDQLCGAVIALPAESVAPLRVAL